MPTPDAPELEEEAPPLCPGLESPERRRGLSLCTGLCFPLCPGQDAEPGPLDAELCWRTCTSLCQVSVLPLELQELLLPKGRALNKGGGPWAGEEMLVSPWVSGLKREMLLCPRSLGVLVAQLTRCFLWS